MARRSAVTSTQIAREAGVAQSTVSRVLNGGSVAPDTRRRVLEVVAKYDFEPSQAARSLVGTRTGLIGVVVGDLVDPATAVVVQAMERALHERDLRAFLVTDVLSTSEAVAALRREGVDGVVCTRAVRDDPLVTRLVGHGIPLVLCDRTLEGFTADQVGADDRACGRLAAEHLTGLGHRRLGVLRGPGGGERARGFREGAADAGADVVELAGDVRDVLAAPDRPTGLFCHDDAVAWAVLNAASALGVAVPGQLSVVGCGDLPPSAWERLDLTTVRRPLGDLAEAAVDRMAGRLADPDARYLQIQLPVELIVRGSTAAPGVTGPA